MARTTKMLLLAVLAAVVSMTAYACSTPAAPETPASIRHGSGVLVGGNRTDSTAATNGTNSTPVTATDTTGRTGGTTLGGN